MLQIYDTTLRDGTQGEGISFSVTDKLRITEMLDEFGIDYIEGGWPGSNPRDLAYFEQVRSLELKHAKIAAFGSTRRAGVPVEEDPQIKLLIDAETPVVTIFGKTWLLHVTDVIRTTAEENLAMIRDSVRFLVEAGREVVYDAEHFYDGYFDNPEYALKTLEAAAEGGASYLVLCDTNGGRLVDEIAAATQAVKERFPDIPLGIHAHNDAGLGVAVSLAAVNAGATMIQGTINGYGERVGNANLTTILPNLFLKMGRDAACRKNLRNLRTLSLSIDEIANLRPDPKAPYVGLSAFTHKGGTHADATKKVAHSYQHIDPEAVGNKARVLISDMAGRSSLLLKARELGVELDRGSESTRRVIDQVKELENLGYEFEAADGSLQLLLMKNTGQYRDHFEFEAYRVIVERRTSDDSLIAEATVKLRVDGEPVYTVAECTGPIGALDKALRKAIEKIHPEIRDVELRDYKVRILSGAQGTGAKTRVLIESSDGQEIWGTVGVSDNIVDASWQALRDSVEYKLLKQQKKES